MRPRLRAIPRPIALFGSLLLLAGAAANPPSPKPPENYQGPVAEAPVAQPGDYWVYQRPAGEKFKGRSETQLKYVEFPLWVGKAWSYETQSRSRWMYGVTSRTALRVEHRCEIVSYKPVTMLGETFDAFECHCQCSIPGAMDDYTCAAWTWWYAPAVKNIVRFKGEGTGSTYELVEYKFSKTPLEPGALDPKTAYDFTDRGNTYFDWKDYDHAIEDYDRALELDSSYAPAYFSRARAYQDKRDYERSLQDYTQAIRLKPTDAAAFNNRGNIYRDTKDYRRALEDYDRSIWLNPNYALAFTNRGNLYREQKNYDRAIEDYNRAIEFDPSDASAYFNRARAYQLKLDVDRALADYTQAISLRPNYSVAFNNRGLIYRDKKEYELALRDFDESLRINPKYTFPYNNRGNVYRDKKDYDRAIQDYDEAIRLNPKYALAFNNRATAYRAKQDYERSLADYEAAARIDPKLAQHRPIGYTLFFLGRTAESAAAMERALKARPDDVYAILWRYMTVAKQGDRGAASGELAENAAKLKERPWPAPVLDFYLGKIDEKAIYAAAADPDPKKSAEQVCEVKFFVAEAKLLNGAAEEAVPLLHAAEQECPPTFYESHAARAELKRLKQPPS
ncbi:MAG TPA: tetratricopeptide repeat protein [Verrucomicrobiae bacterium]|nr:tetratricopeptide repeat protein [Verrucomicrobiae bacterium]